MARVTQKSQRKHLEREAEAVEKLVYKGLVKLDEIQNQLDALDGES